MSTTFYQKKNNAKTTITNNPLTSGGLLITLASSTGALFPTTGATWLATIWSTNADPSVATDTEVVLIDSRSTDTLTVNVSGRGYAGTTAVSHPTGSYIQLLVMKEHMTQYETAINTLEASSVGTYTPWTTWSPTITSTGGTFTGTAVPLARWTQVGKMVTASAVITGTAAGNLVIIKFTLPVTPLQNTAKYVVAAAAIDSNTIPYVAHAMYAWDSTATMNVQREVQAVIGAGAVTCSVTVTYEVA